ncbi:hypothetical protein SAMN04515695_3638 [Pseudovibrio sp. Tun.PSC04-5.I4]|nr:hypothetical protein SAMN04515695_3638 [Pseudovibrio sp. Tun.PSC04-5.I4]
MTQRRGDALHQAPSPSCRTSGAEIRYPVPRVQALVGGALGLSASAGRHRGGVMPCIKHHHRHAGRAERRSGTQCHECRRWWVWLWLPHRVRKDTEEGCDALQHASSPSCRTSGVKIRYPVPRVQALVGLTLAPAASAGRRWGWCQS